jgi:hypothetical protein
MAWWFSPDRLGEFRQRIEGAGAQDLSVSESTNDGVRLRTAQWKDRRGWENHHQVETHLGEHGLPERHGDRFIAPASDVVSYQASYGQRVTITCHGQIEFLPHASGVTEVIAAHNHTMTGGAQLRWTLPKRTRKNTDLLFREWIERCQAAVGG